jgi:hypothetical protein
MSDQFIILKITHLDCQEQKVNVWYSSILYKTLAFVKYSNYGLDGFALTQINVARQCSFLGSVTDIQENNIIT